MTNFTSKHALFASAIATFARPILQNIICPQVEGYSKALDNLCAGAVVGTTVLPLVVGTSLSLSGIYQQHSLYSFLGSIKSSAFNLVLPAGLGMIVAQQATNGTDIPLSAVAIGTVKSSLEITAIGAIMSTINPKGALGDLTVLGYTITNQVLYGGLVAISTASSTNTIHYVGKELIHGKEPSMELLSNGADYALGYALARPFYQVGTYFMLDHQQGYGTACMFAAPVFRGVALGALKRGSVTIPGSDHGIVSNVIDGIGIALASLTRSEVGKLEIFKTGVLSNIGSGNFVTAVLLSIIAAPAIYENPESVIKGFSDYVQSTYDNLFNIFESSTIGNANVTADEL